MKCPKCGTEMEVKSAQIPSDNTDWEGEKYVECPHCGYCDLVPLDGNYKYFEEEE